MVKSGTPANNGFFYLLSGSVGGYTFVNQNVRFVVFLIMSSKSVQLHSLK